jgi:hypothetical protein
MGIMSSFGKQSKYKQVHMTAEISQKHKLRPSLIRGILWIAFEAKRYAKPEKQP